MAQGDTKYCVARRGDRRCESQACGFFLPRDRRFAPYRAPSDFSRGGVSIAKNTPLCYSCLASVYPDSVVLKVRQEHLILAEVQRLCPDLETLFLKWDCPVAGGCSLKRPDMLWEMPRFYLQLEVDELGHIHEDNRERLEIIHDSMGGHSPGLVIRINTNNMLTKVQHTDGENKYRATNSFKPKMQEVATFINKSVLEGMGTDALAIPKCCTEDKVSVRKFFLDHTYSAKT